MPPPALSAYQRGVALPSHPGGTDPSSCLKDVTRFLQDLLQGPVLFGGGEKKVDSFVQRLPCLCGSCPTTCHVQRRGVSDILVAFPPNLHVEINLHELNINPVSLGTQAIVPATDEPCARLVEAVGSRATDCL